MVSKAIGKLEATIAEELPPGAMPQGMPPNFIEFVGIENQQLMVSLINRRREFDRFSHLDGLYRAAIGPRPCTPPDFILYQLLFLAHYQLLAGQAAIMRCHLSDAFASARIAIDAALVAAWIIADRASQNAYVSRTKPFDKLVRHYKNLIRDNGRLPSALIRVLIEKHDFCSAHAAHADISVFVHRVNFSGEKNRTARTEYFQFADGARGRFHMLTLLHCFVVVLDMFAPFFVDELKVLPTRWKEELHNLGAATERDLATIKAEIDTEEAASSSVL